MMIRKLAMTIVPLVIFATTSLAQITTIEGTVTGTDGKPVQNAIVKIHRTDVKWDSQTKTDKRGHYIHTGVPLGTFEITLIIDGKETDKVNGVRSALGDHPPTDFDLRKSTAANAANAAKQAELQKALETGQVSDDLKRQMKPEELEKLNKTLEAEKAQIKKRNELNAAFNEGVTALQAKQYDVAVTALTKASENDPGQAAVWANLGDAYLGLAGTKTGPEFDTAVTKGMESYNKSIELKPDDSATHNNYGLALAKAKKFPEAEAELKKAATLDPATAFSRYYNLGALLTNNGQNEEAGKAFKLAIDAAPDNPKNAEAYFQYGILLAAQTTEKDGKYIPPPGTIDALQKYLTLAPTGPNAQTAKDTIAQLGGALETTFKNPNAPTTTKKKK